MGVIYFSAFYSLLFQIRGMLGPRGLLPAGSYLQEVARVAGWARYWYAPTVLWFGSGNHALMALSWIGLLASVALVVNFWPRGMLVVCFVCFLSFVSAAQDFSGYQSDGMLLCAGFICLFLAPAGWRPRWGQDEPPARAPLLLLRLLWFTIYFESGIAKFFGGDSSWRDLSAMNEYYQNGPLPTWIGWYAHQVPVRFHTITAGATLCLELLIPWMLWLPRRERIICFCLVTSLQIGIILTANYAFLNYIVLALGIFLLDDVFLVRFLPTRSCQAVRKNLQYPSCGHWHESLFKVFERSHEKTTLSLAAPVDAAPEAAPAKTPDDLGWHRIFRQMIEAISLGLKALFLAWVFYAMAFLMLQQMPSGLPLPAKPVELLEPFRIANSYGLFGRMTWARYEIEFQGSNDGTNWIAYPFRYKPQALNEAPGIYAPYQPRFEWNLWFASLGSWRENSFVVRTEQQLLMNNQDVLALFRSNPFSGAPPKQVRAVLWQYWFTDRATRRATGNWWHREERGLYAPTLERLADGRVIVSEYPN
jgi:uncharacterized membrane protein YphA (DoxX/SURF4 family)